MHTTLIYRTLAHIHTVHTQMHITYYTHMREHTYKYTTHIYMHTTLNTLAWTNTHMHTHA